MAGMRFKKNKFTGTGFSETFRRSTVRFYFWHMTLLAKSFCLGLQTSLRCRLASKKQMAWTTR
jgi:hypothetical protein